MHQCIKFNLFWIVTLHVSDGLLVRDDTCSPPCPHISILAPILLYNVYRVPFPGVKGQGPVADNLPPSRAEVKERAGYNSTPSLCFHDRLYA